jgi:arylsulfatase A-like enzyme
MRYGDAAVERIFRALDTSGRFEDALVLVTSDHGEAFFEHGKLDHNSTVYDEMLHVPFVLRLPGGMKPPGIDLDRMASLEDLVPTVLARVGLDPGARQTGVDLLGAKPRRSILHRTATQQNILGFRYGRWKLISDRRGVVSELYDLEDDPDERHNLLVARPDVVSWMIAAWQATLAAEPEPFELGTREISDADREMLEQLGYLDG